MNGARRVALGVLAVAAAVASVVAMLRTGSTALALALHVVAALLTTATAPRGDRVYRTAILACTLAVPVLGPMFGALVLRRPAAGTRNAHAFFEDYEREVQGELALERPEADSLGAAMSFHEVLRHGSIDHRRNALRKLAERGQPMHLALLRRCLAHADMELRLGAFREINRLLQDWEHRLDGLAAAAAANPEGVAERIALSQARRAYATSGLLDREMRRLQLEAAMAACREARAIDLHDTQTGVEQALVFIALEDLAGAERTLAAVRPADRDLPELCVARAQLAFRLRRFEAVAAEAARLTAAQEPLPAWMRELEAVS